MKQWEANVHKKTGTITTVTPMIIQPYGSKKNQHWSKSLIAV